MECRHRPGLGDCWAKEKKCVLCGARSIVPVKNWKSALVKWLPRLSLLFWAGATLVWADGAEMRRLFPGAGYVARAAVIFLSGVPFFGPIGLGKRLMLTYFMDYEKEQRVWTHAPACRHVPAFEVRVGYRGYLGTQQTWTCKHCGARIEVEKESMNRGKNFGAMSLAILYGWLLGKMDAGAGIYILAALALWGFFAFSVFSFAGADMRYRECGEKERWWKKLER